MPCEEHQEPSDAARWWNRRARQTAGLVNLAWVLDKLAAPMLLTCVGISLAILVDRMGGDPIGPWHLVVASACVAAVMLIGWMRARRGFESPAQSLVRIETSLGLHNALNTARSGASAWPPPPVGSFDHKAGLRWQWGQLAAAPLLSIATVAASLWIPIQSGAAASKPPPSEPLVWSQLDQELDALMESAHFEESYLLRTQDRIEQLRNRDPSEWFSHNTMEATDALVDSHRSEVERLNQALERGSQALDQMRDADRNDRIQQFDEYRNALEDIADGVMQPDEIMRQQLLALGQENPDALTREQIEQLQQQLQNARDALKQAQELLEFDPEHLADGTPMPGAGGQDEGGEHVPGVLGEPNTPEMEDGDFTPLAAQDLSRAGLGDLLGIQDSPHQPSENQPSFPVDGGTTEATGHGGDRVWRDALDPAEQRTLRKFFE